MAIRRSRRSVMDVGRGSSLHIDYQQPVAFARPFTPLSSLSSLAAREEDANVFALVCTMVSRSLPGRREDQMHLIWLCHRKDT
ncbi:unnamed protein product [Arctogadus glacialis]